MAEFVPVKAFVSDDRFQLMEVSGENSPRDPCIVWQTHRTVNSRIAPLSQSTKSVTFTDLKLSEARFA